MDIPIVLAASAINFALIKAFLASSSLKLFFSPELSQPPSSFSVYKVTLLPPKSVTL
jgi:hypothetical protein